MTLLISYSLIFYDRTKIKVGKEGMSKMVDRKVVK